MPAINIPRIIVLSLIVGSCSPKRDPEDLKSEPVDSTQLYMFFLDKISPTWDYSPDNDSVTFQFDHYGLPESRSEIKMIGSSIVHFSIAYDYNLEDSTETVRHLQQYGGGHTFTQIRKFDDQGNVLWVEEIDVYHNRRRVEYDSNGEVNIITPLNYETP